MQSRSHLGVEERILGTQLTGSIHCDSILLARQLVGTDSRLCLACSWTRKRQGQPSVDSSAGTQVRGRTPGRCGRRGRRTQQRGGSVAAGGVAQPGACSQQGAGGGGVVRCRGFQATARVHGPSCFQTQTGAPRSRCNHALNLSREALVTLQRPFYDFRQICKAPEGAQAEQGHARAGLLPAIKT